MVKSSVDRDDYLIHKTTLSGIEAVDGALRIRLEPIDTKHLTGRFIHELKITDAHGYKSFPTKGRIVIIEASIKKDPS